MVVIFHFFPKSFTIGASGVDIFFVISGFIMGSIASNDAPLVFLRKRLLRIAPLYWIFTLLMCLGSILGLYSNFQFSAATLLKSLLFIPYFNDNFDIWPLMVVGWTLNIEMFFYAVFALGLAFRAPFFLSSIVLVGIASLGALADFESASLTLWSSPLILEFLAGILLSRIVISYKIGAILFFAGLMTLAISHQFLLFAESYRLLTWGTGAVLIVAGAVSIERHGHWPKQSLWAVERIGDASYSLYLSHGFVVAGFHRFLGTSAIVSLVGIVASVCVAMFVYLTLEKPINDLVRRSNVARVQSA
jgi:exopolysaccharide production protein ExoZ